MYNLCDFDNIWSIVNRVVWREWRRWNDFDCECFNKNEKELDGKLFGKMYRHYYKAELTELNVVTFIMRQIPLIRFLRHFTLDLMYTRLPKWTPDNKSAWPTNNYPVMSKLKRFLALSIKSRSYFNCTHFLTLHCKHHYSLHYSLIKHKFIHSCQQLWPVMGKTSVECNRSNVGIDSRCERVLNDSRYWKQ